MLLRSELRRLRDNKIRMNDVKLLSWIETGQIVSTLLVAVGVVGEFAGTFLARPVQRRLDQKRVMEIVRLRKGAADAELRAAELEARIQPRYLTTHQEKTVTDAMVPFAGKGFVIASHWSDMEAARLAGQIKSVLNNAGLGINEKTLYTTTVDRIGAYPEISGGLLGGGGGFSGINLHTGIEIWGVDHVAVKTLTHALTADAKVSAVSVLASKDPFDNLYGEMPLIVFVGSKPIPEVR
jgi:hypothetical protein